MVTEGGVEIHESTDSDEDIFGVEAPRVFNDSEISDIVSKVYGHVA